MVMVTHRYLLLVNMFLCTPRAPYAILLLLILLLNLLYHFRSILHTGQITVGQVSSFFALEIPTWIKTGYW